MGDFIAVDVETANADCASLCQIGMVEFDRVGPGAKWQSLLNPEEAFDPMNVSIHGITEADVIDAPRFPDVYEQLRAALSGRVVVCHTPFDKVAIRRACERYGLPAIECRWLDSARVTRRTWPEFRRAGYGLANVAGKLGIGFDHHVAEEDAKAAGLIVLAAIGETGLSINDWLARVEAPISGPAQLAALEANPDGPLYGEVVVFTGALTIPRDEAARVAASLGCEVGAGVTKDTTLLVVGDQDERKLAGYEKSSKHRKAESLIEKGQRIRIVSELDFRTLANLDVPDSLVAARQPQAKARHGRRRPHSIDLMVEIKVDKVEIVDGKPSVSVSVSGPDNPAAAEPSAPALLARVQRSITEPIRIGISWQERWSREDHGLIACWERGREMRAARERYLRVRADAPPRALDAEDEDGEAEAAMRAAAAERLEPAAEWAARGELRPLPWRGGVVKKLKAKIRPGTLQYLAMWQGLRGENLDIDTTGETRLRCARTGQVVVFSRLAAAEETEDATGVTSPIPAKVAAASTATQSRLLDGEPDDGE